MLHGSTGHHCHRSCHPVGDQVSAEAERRRHRQEAYATCRPLQMYAIVFVVLIAVYTLWVITLHTPIKTDGWAKRVG